MTDPLSAITSAAAIGSKSDEISKAAATTGAALWLKVLGPPAEAIGTHLRSRIEHWSEDALARRVLERAAQKVDQDVPGTVPPRMAADIFEKAQWADDEFVAEYLSGVLATARTPEGKDDRGVSWTALVGRLASSQLRLHYMLYATARSLMLGQQISNLQDLTKFEIYVPIEALYEEIGPETINSFNEGIMNLQREGLVGTQLEVFADLTNWTRSKRVSAGPSMIYTLSSAGIMLFFRGGGSGSTTVGHFTSPALDLNFDPMSALPTPVPGAALVADLPNTTQ